MKQFGSIFFIMILVVSARMHAMEGNKVACVSSSRALDLPLEIQAKIKELSDLDNTEHLILQGSHCIVSHPLDLKIPSEGTYYYPENNGTYSDENTSSRQIFIEEEARSNKKEDKEKRRERSIIANLKLTDRVRFDHGTDIRLITVSDLATRTHYRSFVNKSEYDKDHPLVHSVSSLEGIVSASAVHPKGSMAIVSRVLANDRVQLDVLRCPLWITLDNGYEIYNKEAIQVGPSTKLPSCDRLAFVTENTILGKTATGNWYLFAFSKDINGAHRIKMYPQPIRDHALVDFALNPNAPWQIIAIIRALIDTQRYKKGHRSLVYANLCDPGVLVPIPFPEVRNTFSLKSRQFSLDDVIKLWWTTNEYLCFQSSIKELTVSVSKTCAIGKIVIPY